MTRLFEQSVLDARKTAIARPLGPVGWDFGDFVFGSAFDVLSDTTKIRVAGFGETLDPADALIDAIERQIAARILP